MTTNSLIEEMVGCAAPFEAVRRDIHAHPELGFDVDRTANLVAEKLRGWGYEVATGVGGSGVVGRLRNGGGNRSLGIRADMDALPIQEATGVEWASRIDGRMHACGHDGHTAILLAAAEHFSRERRFSGTLNLIFQPDEEGLSGGPAMIRDGLFERFPCDAIYALHNAPGLPVGSALVVDGYMLPGCDRAVVTVKGVGGHGANPHNTRDPVVAAAAIVMALQTIPSRNVPAADFCVVTVGALNAGTTANVIPETAILKLDVRTRSPQTAAMVEARIREIVAGQVASFGLTADISYTKLVPTLNNHREETAFARDVLTELLGEDRVITSFHAPDCGSEDFAWMLQALPGCYIGLGNGQGKWHGCQPHNPGFDFNDAAIPIGAAYWVRLAERYLA
jgi:hippurate hydrolase